MQKSTGKELVVKAKALTKEGARLVELMNDAEASVYRNVNLANYRAWEFGKFLARAKDEIGHGLFLNWLDAAFPKIHKRKSQRCQELFARNSKATELSLFSDQALTKWISKLDADSVRKFRLGYVPDKDQPEHKGNSKFPRLVSFLNIANEYARIEQRYKDGLDKQFDFDEAREETKSVYAFMKWLHGDADENPWDAKT